MLVSSVQQSDSDMCVCVLFFRFFSIVVYYEIPKYIVNWYRTVNFGGIVRERTLVITFFRIMDNYSQSPFLGSGISKPNGQIFLDCGCSQPWEDSISVPYTPCSSSVEWGMESACTQKQPALCKAVMYVDSMGEKKKNYYVFHYPMSPIHPPLTSELHVNK